MSKRHEKRYLAVLLLALPLLGTACAASSAGSQAERAAVVQRQGDAYRITLSPDTVRRLAIRTTAARPAVRGTMVPYSALIYSANGRTWAYVRDGASSFMRRLVIVDRIDGTKAFVARGLSPGNRVVSQGVVELRGIETSGGA
jgi:hypothetical protein